MLGVLADRIAFSKVFVVSITVDVCFLEYGVHKVENILGAHGIEDVFGARKS